MLPRRPVPFWWCLVDEADSILIDEARTPLIISETTAAPEGKSFVLLKDHELKMTNRLKPFDEIRHDAVLSLDNDVTLHQEEIDFSFSVWQAFPHRIVGFPSRVNYFNFKIFLK